MGSRACQATGNRVTSFRLNAGRPVNRMRVDGPVPSKPTRVRNRETGAVGTLTCGHKFYEPYSKHGKYIWCDECEHNREIMPKPKPTGEVVPDDDNGLFPF